VSIPKIIHQVWDGPMLPGIQECLDSVKRVMPDYDVRVYNGEEVNEVAPDKVAFVKKTDLFRNLIVHRDGGWWVDADCFILKPFDGDRSYSYGLQEQGEGCLLTEWLFGSEAKNPDQMRCLNWIKDNSLINPYGGVLNARRGVIRVNSRPQSAYKGGIDAIGEKDFLPYAEYGSRYFAKHSRSRRLPTNPTAVHLFMGSWVKSATGVLSEVKEVERWG